jgi:hypothetical protein
LVDAVANRTDFKLLISKDVLVKETESWLSQHAQKPGQLRNVEPEWLVDKMILRGGLHNYSAKQGSFKSIMALFLALSLVTGMSYLGRKVRTVFGEDARPLRIYYIDRENPESLARVNCLRIELDNSSTGNVFKVLGEWLDESPILAFDDPRLIEAAKRERAFFIFDSLSQFIGTASENDNSEMTVELNKAKSLSRICEGVLFLHHDDKAGSGWRGCTAIVAIPDMCFNLERGEDNTVTFSELRFRATEKYAITAKLHFGDPDEPCFKRRYTYEVVESTLDTKSRAAKAAGRNAKDAELIERARLKIEENAKAGQEPMSQSTLMKLVGIKGGSVRDRILCAGTKDDPRPWTVERGPRNSVVFVPLAQADSESEPITAEDGGQMLMSEAVPGLVAEESVF